MTNNKYAAILHNYNYPTDRFNLEYGKPGKNQHVIDLIETAGKQGLVRGLEMNMDESDPEVCIGINFDNWKDIKSALDDYGLDLIGVSPVLWGGNDFIKGTLGASDPKVRRQALDDVKRAIELADLAGAPYINIWPGQDGFDYYFEVDYQKMYTWWVEGMQEIADFNPSLRLGLEPKPFEPRSYSFIDTVSKSLLLLKDIDRENVGVNIDVGHLLYSHESLGESVALLQAAGNKLFHLHLNDNYSDADADMMFASVHFLAFVELFYWLRKTDYKGWKALDLFPYRTDPAATIGEGVRWMMAFDNMVDDIGLDRLDKLIINSNPVENMSFFREYIFGK